MAFICGIILALAFQNVLSREIPRELYNSRNDDLELKLVHVIFRHSSRTPADTYPNDPHVDQTFEPFGWGQLTNEGRNQIFETGKFLRHRYDEFLGRKFNLEEVYAQSTGVTRTKMSLQLLLAGLFPPKGTSLEWNRKLNWLPIPYNYEELDKDSLLLVRKSCPRYHEELERVFAEDIAEELEDNFELFKELTQLTGLTVKTPDDIQSLFSTLKAEKEFGLKLPDWTKNYFPDKLKQLTDKSYVYNAYNSELKRLKGGVFVKQTIGDWDKKINENLKPKIFLYSGHDATVTNILSAFNVWDLQFPDYGITAILELSKHKKTGTYGVEIFLRNSTKVAPYQLTIPGCSEFCSLSDVKDLLQENIPIDWQQECNAKTKDFTEPTLGGP